MAMLETVSRGFRAARNRLMGKAEITPELVDESLRDIRVALLEADVAFDVVKKFVATVREKAVGTTVELSATDKKGKKVKASAQDHFIKICHDQLEALMGPVDTRLTFRARSEVSGIMMVGLQGSGKTTTVGKLATRLKKDGRKLLLVAADIYRPAAVDQLKVLGERVGVPVFFEAGLSPVELSRKAYERARAEKLDTVLIDTAGRLAIDEGLMQELEGIKAAVGPDNILLVADAMVGQDAVRTAAEFNRRIGIDGFILTKLDGDARGGAALSIKEVTGKPIKFLGLGESLDKLEEFRPDGLASRILGFGDVVGLMMDFESVVDQDKAEADAQKLLSGKFNFKDFVEQIRTVRRMGSIKDLLDKMPLFGELTDQLNPDEKRLDLIEALYNSMTEQERLEPHRLDASRLGRIARGAGKKPPEAQEIVAQFFTMQKMMANIGANPGLLGNLPFFKDLGQLSRMKGMDLSSVFGKDPLLQQAMGGGMPGMPGLPAMPGMPGLPTGYTPPMNQAQLARARMMGLGNPFQPQAKQASQAERDAIRERRKREKDNKKKNRKKR